jgi:hypothetical protein
LFGVDQQGVQPIAPVVPLSPANDLKYIAADQMIGGLHLGWKLERRI